MFKHTQHLHKVRKISWSWFNIETVTQNEFTVQKHTISFTQSEHYPEGNYIYWQNLTGKTN